MDNIAPEALLYQGENVLRWRLRWFIFYWLSVLLWISGLVLFRASLYYKTYIKDNIGISFLPEYDVLTKEFGLILMMVVGYAVFCPFWLLIVEPLLRDRFKYAYDWCWIIRTIWKLMKISMFGALVYDINVVPKRQKYSTMDLYLLGASLCFAALNMLVRQMVQLGRCINLEGPLVDMAVGIALCMPDVHKLKWGKWTVISTAVAVIILTLFGDYLKHLRHRRRVPPPP